MEATEIEPPEMTRSSVQAFFRETSSLSGGRRPLSLSPALQASDTTANVDAAVRSEAGTAAGEGRAPAPSGPKETAERLPDPKP